MIRPAGSSGGFELKLVIVDGRIDDVTLVSHRPLSLPRALVGRPVAQAPQLAAALLPNFATAQTAASLEAIERALGLPISRAQIAARALLVLGEMAAHQAWRFAIDWPALSGGASDAERVGRLRSALMDLASLIFYDGIWNQPGGGTVTADRAGLDRLVTAVERELQSLVLGQHRLPQSVDALHGWVETARTAPAMLIRECLAKGWQAVGAHGLPAIGFREAAWLGDRLASDPNFGLRPHVDGSPAEVGAFADMRSELLETAEGVWGEGLPARLLAAALQALSLADRMRAALAELQDEPRRYIAASGTGAGVGMAETIAGPIAHWLRLDHGVVRDYRCVLPAEWNFHPEGPVVAALRQAGTVGEPERAAALLVAAFEPAAPVSVTVKEHADAL